MGRPQPESGPDDSRSPGQGSELDLVSLVQPVMTR